MTTQAVAARARSAPRLTRRQSKALLIVHIGSSVGWLGLSLGVLALAIAGRSAGRAGESAAAYYALDVLAGTVILPMGVLALTTGAALGLGTGRGLLRHRWLVGKLVLTGIGLALTAFALPASIDEARAAAAGLVDDAGALDEAGVNLIAAGIVSSTLYAAALTLAVVKPWGLTSRGRARKQRR